MKQLGALIVLSLAVLRIQAKLGPYYAHVCSGMQTKIQCPGDFQISFNGMIYAHYPNKNTTCGSVSAEDTTLLALCSTLIATAYDQSPLAESFQSQCAGNSECSLTLNFEQATSVTCNLTGVQNVIRVMFSCVLTTGQDETVVCSDPRTGQATTQFLACPSNMVLNIDKIWAQSTGSGSVCNSYLGPNNDFEPACSYALSPSHDFYRLVVDTCSGWTACAVKGTLIENANSNASCATRTERNFQRIYYSCVPDNNLKITVCPNDWTSLTPALINCDCLYIKITNVVADRIYNGNPSACPVEDSVKNVAVFGCAVQIQDLQFLDNIARNCDGKTSCEVSTSAYVAAPCGPDNARTRNWFAISHRCTKTPETDGYRVGQACSGSQMTLQCPTGAAMSLGSVYATVLFATGNDGYRGDYSCNTALRIGNPEVTSCTLQLSSNGSGRGLYNTFMTCEGTNACSVTISDAVEGPECIDYSRALNTPRIYTRRDLFYVQYMCVTQRAINPNGISLIDANKVIDGNVLKICLVLTATLGLLMLQHVGTLVRDYGSDAMHGGQTHFV